MEHVGLAAKSTEPFGKGRRKGCRHKEPLSGSMSW